MIQVLIANPLLLLFVVVAVGYPLGRIKVAGVSLGVASVLFAGLAIGALNPKLRLPEILYQFGLVLFVYTIGLSNGRAFFESFKRKGFRDNSLVLALIAVAAGLTIIAHNVLRLRPTLAVGMFTGSLTNTPALAGVLDYIRIYAPPAALARLVNDPVVGYSVAYPMGVVGMILAIAVLQRLWKIDYAQEAQAVREHPTPGRRIYTQTIRVTQPDVTHRALSDLQSARGWDIVFGRVKRDSQLAVATSDTRLEIGDLITAVGTHEELDQATTALGETSAEHLELDRSEIDYRRIFVSNPKVAGQRLSDLNLPQQFGAIVTRVRRGDVEFVPRGDTVLELGDRVRVVTHTRDMDAVTNFLGDSYRALSEIDILTFSLGLLLGLLLGLVPIPLPGGVTLRLGLAGGPLVVALVLGALDRTGPFVWTLPYNANLTLRQIGLVLFLAGVGTSAGYAFVTTLQHGDGLAIFVAGAIITCVTALSALLLGRLVFHVPMGLLIGMLAGLQTQPAVLGFALEQTGDDLPNIGYATVYPVATIAKILLAELLLARLL